VMRLKGYRMNGFMIPVAMRNHLYSGLFG
jgi:hypothetical protein